MEATASAQDDRLPLRHQSREAGEAHPSQRDERRGLDRRRHETGDRRRSPVIDVRSPHVERHRRDLEAESDDQQSQAEPSHQRIGFLSANWAPISTRLVVPAAP